MHSPLHSPIYTPPSTASPPHSPLLSTALSPHTCPFHSFPFRNGASSAIPAFSANVQEPGRARGWRVSLSCPGMRRRHDQVRAWQTEGALACVGGHVLQKVPKVATVARMATPRRLILFTRNRNVTLQQQIKLPRWLPQCAAAP